MSPESREDYRAGHVTTVARRIDRKLYFLKTTLSTPAEIIGYVRIARARNAGSLNPARRAARVDLVSPRPVRACHQW
ncbi:unnamed protein product [Prunus armeniaca]